MYPVPEPCGTGSNRPAYRPNLHGDEERRFDLLETRLAGFADFDINEGASWLSS